MKSIKSLVHLLHPRRHPIPRSLSRPSYMWWRSPGAVVPRLLPSQDRIPPSPREIVEVCFSVPSTATLDHGRGRHQAPIGTNPCPSR